MSASEPLRYGSVCSGIEAASVAWHPLGWQPAWFAEVDQFCKAVLEYRWPGVHNYGDFRTITADCEPIDVLVGGTPCQSFSVAGRRAGLADPRGVLAFEFLALAERLRPRWVVFENVPGLLSSGRGRDFGAFIGTLGQLGYGCAYRILDAQYFGVPQRRRRVFVVGYLGDWRPPLAVLFDPQSLSGHPAPRRKAPAGVAALTSHGVGTCGADKAHVMISGTLAASGAGSARPAGNANETDLVIPRGMTVRRLTPRECERLQGFPDDYTLVPYRGKPAADGPRYRAVGNSMAVPVMRRIGEGIQQVEIILQKGKFECK